MVLEELEFARRRDAQIYAEVVGYGMSGDAFHITMPDASGSGAVRVMQKALQDANVQPEEVDYINAHGTSTPYNDKFETMAIKKTFGDHAYKVAISSTKPPPRELGTPSSPLGNYTSLGKGFRVTMSAHICGIASRQQIQGLARTRRIARKKDEISQANL